MNSLTELIRINKALKAKSSGGRIRIHVPDHGGELQFTVFLPRFSRLFGLLSFRILQNNLLDLYLVEIRGYKLSFFTQLLTPSDRHFLKFLKAQNTMGAGTRNIISETYKLPVGQAEVTQFLRFFSLLYLRGVLREKISVSGLPYQSFIRAKEISLSFYKQDHGKNASNSNQPTNS